MRNTFPKSNTAGGGTKPGGPGVGAPAKLVLHIGQPKTGSSSLQVWALRNRMALSRAGVFFPVSGLVWEQGNRAGRTSGHLRLLRRLSRGSARERREAMTMLREEATSLGLDFSKCTLLLSSERLTTDWFFSRFLNTTRLRVQRLFEAVDADETQVIGLFRDPLFFGLRYWKERLSNPQNGFKTDVGRFLASLQHRRLLSLSVVSRVFSTSGRNVRTDFDPVLEDQELNSIIWLSQKLGIEQEAIHDTRTDIRLNQALSDRSLWNIRRAKQLNMPVSNRAQMALDLRRLDSQQDADFQLVGPGELERISQMLSVERQEWSDLFDVPIAEIRRTPQPEGEIPQPVFEQYSYPRGFAAIIHNLKPEAFLQRLDSTLRAVLRRLVRHSLFQSSGYISLLYRFASYAASGPWFEAESMKNRLEISRRYRKLVAMLNSSFHGDVVR